jgi:hypothetical protein
MRKVKLAKCSVLLPAPYGSDTLSAGNMQTSRHYALDFLETEESPIGFPCISVKPLSPMAGTRTLYIPITMCMVQFDETDQSPQPSQPPAKKQVR